jgi:NADH-quinone oxidoreductase subunit M
MSGFRSFGVSYALGVDGIALSLILMSAILTPVCILAAWHDVPEGGRREKNYFALMLSLLAFMVGVFAATDVFLFYVFFEAMLIPVYFLIGPTAGRAGSMPRSSSCSSPSPAGWSCWSASSRSTSTARGLDRLPRGAPHRSQLSTSTTQKWLWLGFFIAFAVKAPMWPVHTWLPDAAGPRPARRRDPARRASSTRSAPTA